MRTYREIEAGARPGQAFSNGTEYEMWAVNWCQVPCVHDAGFQREEPDAAGCPLLAASLGGWIPAEWLEQPWTPNGTWKDGSPRSDPPADRYHCIEYRPESDGDGPEPRPVPDPPGQSTLWPREPFEAVRMLTALPEPVAVR